MDKDSFVDMAMQDLYQPEKKDGSSSLKPDQVVETAISDLTGNEKQVVETKAPSTPNSKIDLEKAFSDSIGRQTNEGKEKEEVKDTLAEDIFNAGQSVLEKTLKGLR
jgi:hypothetical protein